MFRDSFETEMLTGSRQSPNSNPSLADLFFSWTHCPDRSETESANPVPADGGVEMRRLRSK